MVNNASVEQFVNTTSGEAPVRGFLHTAHGSHIALVLTHGAGGNCGAPLLVMLAEHLARAGITVLRCDLPFRQLRPRGGPSAGSAARDQQGLRRAVTLLKARGLVHCYLGGQSYGGRQASMLVASEPELVEGLLLLSYPLHPPGNASQLRTAHFPKLKTRALFVHGTKDPFGSIAEMDSALPLIPAPTRLVTAEGAGHGLLPKKDPAPLVQKIAVEFRAFLLAQPDI